MQPLTRELKAPQEYDILTENVAEWGQSGQIAVFHCLEMSHPLADGLQRVRCYPFSNHKYHEAIHKDAVFIIPVTHSPEQFKLPRDKELLQYAKVLLFFKIRIRGHLGLPQTLELAFIKYFDVYSLEG